MPFKGKKTKNIKSDGDWMIQKLKDHAKEMGWGDKESVI